jgi:LPS-assembly lipoprotein
MAALTSGCGFTLRGTLEMPFRSLAVVGFAPHSALERAMRLQLERSTRLVDNPANADVVLQALGDSRERAVVATTAAGQVREFQLRVRLQWRVSTPKGRELISPSELLLTRDMSYSETGALAKEKEAEQLYAAMDEDIAAQVMRRLAKLRFQST